MNKKNIEKNSNKKLFIKLVNDDGYTRNHFIELKPGLVVHRRNTSSNPMYCHDSAVHVYKNLKQAREYDSSHCEHGDYGKVFLVEMVPIHYSYDKVIGKSYKVIKYLDRLGSSKTSRKCKDLGLYE